MADPVYNPFLMPGGAAPAIPQQVPVMQGMFPNGVGYGLGQAVGKAAGTVGGMLKTGAAATLEPAVGLAQGIAGFGRGLVGAAPAAAPMAAQAAPVVAPAAAQANGYVPTPSRFAPGQANTDSILFQRGMPQQAVAAAPLVRPGVVGPAAISARAADVGPAALPATRGAAPAMAAAAPASAPQSYTMAQALQMSKLIPAPQKRLTEQEKVTQLFTNNLMNRVASMAPGKDATEAQIEAAHKSIYDLIAKSTTNYTKGQGAAMFQQQQDDDTN